METISMSKGTGIVTSVPSDSPDDIANKVHALEYKYYPEVIEEIAKGIQ